MTDKQLEAILQQDRKNIRNGWHFVLSAVSVALALIVVFVAVTHGLLTQAQMTWLGMGLLILLVISLSVYGRNPAATPFDLWDEALLQKTVDIHQRNWHIGIATSTFSLFPIALVLVQRLNDWQPGDRFCLALMTVALGFIVLQTLIVTFYGPPYSSALRRVVTDELTRSHQMKAASFGFGFAVLALCAATVAEISDPTHGLAVLPILLALSTALPSLYFLFLQRRGSRGD